MSNLPQIPSLAEISRGNQMNLQECAPEIVPLNSRLNVGMYMSQEVGTYKTAACHVDISASI
jgi:hypothetical protein